MQTGPQCGFYTYLIKQSAIDLPISRHDGANKLRSANNARVLYLGLGTTVERENKHIQKNIWFLPQLRQS